MHLRKFLKLSELIFLQHSDRLFLGVWDLDEALFSLFVFHINIEAILLYNRGKEKITETAKHNVDSA